MAIEQEVPSKEIIDATQNAVMDAAGSVANIIENTAHEISGHGEAFYQSAEFWVAVSFVLVVVLLGRPVAKVVRKMLARRINTIAHRIREAAELKEEAQKLLVEYEKKFIHAKDEAEDILEKSEREINLIKKESFAKLENEMAAKEKEAWMRIESAQATASAEVRKLTSELTINAVKKVVAEHLDEKAQERLIDKSIELISRIKQAG